MAGKKVTPEDISLFNKLHYEGMTFAAIARETGFSSSTVSKYTDRNWKPVDESKIKRFHVDDLPEFTGENFLNLDNYGALCIMSTEEKYGIEELWGEIDG